MHRRGLLLRVTVLAVSVNATGWTVPASADALDKGYGLASPYMHDNFATRLIHWRGVEDGLVLLISGEAMGQGLGKVVETGDVKEFVICSQGTRNCLPKSLIPPVSLHASSSRRYRLVKKHGGSKVLTSEDFEHLMWQTQGIILRFNEWPDGQETVRILKELEALGMEKTEELPVTRVWFLKYIDNIPRNVIEAHSICKKLIEQFSLKYCRPERMPRPRNGIEPGEVCEVRSGSVQCPVATRSKPPSPFGCEVRSSTPQSAVFPRSPSPPPARRGTVAPCPECDIIPIPSRSPSRASYWPKPRTCRRSREPVLET